MSRATLSAVVGLSMIGLLPAGAEGISVRPRVSVSMAWAVVSLPDGLGIASVVAPSATHPGTTVPVAWGKEPSLPNSALLTPSLGVDLRIRQRLVVGVEVPWSLFSTHFREGFTQRQAFHPPGWGETYTYSRVTRFERIPTFRVGILRRTYDTSSYGSPRHLDPPQLWQEYGIKVAPMRVTVDQGLDAWNARQSLQQSSATGIVFSLYLNRPPYSFELGPVGSLDFDRYGRGGVYGVSAAYSRLF